MWKAFFVAVAAAVLVAVGIAFPGAPTEPTQIRTVTAAAAAVPTSEAAHAAAVEQPTPTTDAPATVDPAPAPPVEQPVTWPIPEAPPAPPEGRTVCEIVHTIGAVSEVWGIYGTTTLPRGTVFTLTVTTDGITQTVDYTVRAGGVVISGVRYGPVDGYTDDGTSVFGPAGGDQFVRLEPGHGPVTATVTYDGTTHCTLETR